MTHIWDFFFMGTIGPPYVEILRFECYLNTMLHFKIWRHVVFLNWKFFSKLCYKQEMRRSHLPNKMISFQTQKHAILNYTSDKTHFLGCCCLSGIAIFAKRVTWNYACSPCSRLNVICSQKGMVELACLMWGGGLLTFLVQIFPFFWLHV